MQITPGIFLVASGWLGFGLTDRRDAHAYLVGDADGAVLIDSGCGLSCDAIVANIASCGIPPRAVSQILITHAHADHSGGAAELAARLGAQVVASPITAAILRAADEDAAGLTSARAAGTYPPQVRLYPVEVAEFAGALDAGGWSITAIETPGHASGHLAFIASRGETRVLFSGDLVFSRGRVVVLATPDTDIGCMATSIGSVATQQPTVLLPGHGELVLAAATEHLAVALDAFANQQLPRGLI